MFCGEIIFTALAARSSKLVADPNALKNFKITSSCISAGTLSQIFQQISFTILNTTFAAGFSGFFTIGHGTASSINITFCKK
jgi:hypothetical protein